jgi:hypothetical protein
MYKPLRIVITLNADGYTWAALQRQGITLNAACVEGCYEDARAVVKLVAYHRACRAGDKS